VTCECTRHWRTEGASVYAVNYYCRRGFSIGLSGYMIFSALLMHICCLLCNTPTSFLLARSLPNIHYSLLCLYWPPSFSLVISAILFVAGGVYPLVRLRCQSLLERYWPGSIVQLGYFSPRARIHCVTLSPHHICEMTNVEQLLCPRRGIVHASNQGVKLKSVIPAARYTELKGMFLSASDLDVGGGSAVVGAVAPCEGLCVCQQMHSSARHTFPLSIAIIPNKI
jgi:hypothetical protein